MSLCYRNKRFLFEVRPDLFPEGMLTDTEVAMWGMFQSELDASRSGAHG